MSCSIGDPTCSSPALCPIGTVFSQNSLSGTCVVCNPNDVNTPLQAGYYCDAGVVTLCPAGFYCPYVAQSSPLPCPEDYICRAGYTQPVECNKLSVCAAGATSKKPGVGAILILVAMLVVTGLAVWLVRSLRRRRARKSNSAATKHKEVKRVFSTLVQSVTGAPSASEPLQGFNEKIRYTSPVSIQFENLGMTLRGSGAIVLEGVTGEFPAGSLVAVMGGSGAGKSTFMNALADRAPYGIVSGQVALNGVMGETIGKYPRLVGFVPQDDIMHDDLTVYENLLYSARLRLPPSVSTSQQRAIVEDVLEILDLNRIRDSVVGSPEKRGISGGQKKRVNIGMELVAYPRVLFLDEPTSGLDSTASLQVARCLQRMRSLGITVVTVIHQPRWSVFRCFSHCLLLARGGRTAFLGPTGAIQTYFESIGFELPKGENVADWFIDIVSGQSVKRASDGSVERDFVAERDLPVVWKQRGTELLATVAGTEIGKRMSGIESGMTEDEIVSELQTAINLPIDTELGESDIARLCRMKEIPTNDTGSEALFRQLTGAVPAGSRLTTRTLATVISKSCADDAISRAPSQMVDSDNVKLVNRQGASFVSQFNTVVSRSIAKFNTSELIVKSLVAAVGAIIVAATFKGALDYSQIPVSTQSGLILFAIISAASFLYVFGDERLVFTRESQTGFSISAYWLAKNVVNVIDMVVITVFFYTFYFIISQPDYRFVEGLSVYLLLAWYTSSVSHFFSVTLSNASALLLAVLVPAIEISLFSGIKPQLPTATEFQKVLAYIGCGWYSVEDLTLFEVKALPENVANIAPVQAMLTAYAYDLNDLTKNSWIMVALGAAVRVLTLAALLIKVYGFPGRNMCARRKTAN